MLPVHSHLVNAPALPLQVHIIVVVLQQRESFRFPFEYNFDIFLQIFHNSPVEKYIPLVMVHYLLRIKEDVALTSLVHPIGVFFLDNVGICAGFLAGIILNLEKVMISESFAFNIRRCHLPRSCLL